MRVAVIAPTQIPSRTANSLQVMKMTQAIARLGYEVRLAVPRRSHQQPEWATLAQHYGMQQEFAITWLPAHPRLRSYDFGYHAVRWGRAWGADLIYTRLPQAAALSSQMGRQTILEIHDVPHGRLGPWLFQRFLRGRGAARLVAITRSLASDLALKRGAPDIPPFTIIAPDGVDLIRYENLPKPKNARYALREFQGREAGFTAGYTGHLYAGRGIDMILDMAKRLPEITFLLAGGEPDDVARYQSQVSDQNIDNVILAGFIPNAELPIYQAACDVLLMPYQERVAASSGGDIAPYLSPMKLFEYMAAGRAILSSSLPVLQEVLDAQNAVLLQPDDLEAWIQAVAALSKDPKQCSALGARARQDARKYTWEERAGRILQGIGAKHA